MRVKTRGRELAEQFRVARGLIDDLSVAIDQAIRAAREEGFKIGVEHAVAGGDEASKRHGIPRHLLPLVMYFGNEEDRREMIDAVQEAKPGMIKIKIPERKP
jgi:hypothetical protein